MACIQLDDFAALIEKFGLLAADSLPFRKYLTELGFMTSASGKARGRDKNHPLMCCCMPKSAVTAAEFRRLERTEGFYRTNIVNH